MNAAGVKNNFYSLPIILYVSFLIRLNIIELLLDTAPARASLHTTLFFKIRAVDIFKWIIEVTNINQLHDGEL